MSTRGYSRENELTSHPRARPLFRASKLMRAAVRSDRFEAPYNSVLSPISWWCFVALQTSLPSATVLCNTEGA
eukprot:6061040-Pleurochrysis_carterae.AAC.3